MVSDYNLKFISKFFHKNYYKDFIIYVYNRKGITVYKVFFIYNKVRIPFVYLFNIILYFYILLYKYYKVNTIVINSLLPNAVVNQEMDSQFIRNLSLENTYSFY